MAYRDLRKIFHGYPKTYATEYESRFNSDQSHKVGFDVSGSPAFFVMTPEIYQAAIDAAKIDKEIYQLILSLPGKAIQSYRESNLIDEIVITNEIEGVRSTRREIGDVLERLEENDKRGRFHGLVQKYQMLSREEDIAICTAQMSEAYTTTWSWTRLHATIRITFPTEPSSEKALYQYATPPVSPFTREWSQNRRSLFALRKRSIF